MYVHLRVNVCDFLVTSTSQCFANELYQSSDCLVNNDETERSQGHERAAILIASRLAIEEYFTKILVYLYYV